MSRANFPIVVHVLLRRAAPDPQIFLLRRANTGFLDGYYALPGGHVHEGELPLAAAMRECQEETGCVPLNLQPLCVMPYRSGSHNGINLIYESDQFDRTPVIAEPELADLALWASELSLPEPRAGWISRVLEMQGKDQWYTEFDTQ
ncbi:MAG: NUDIX domain-containing protein [Pseudomonadales bacterium]